MINPDKKIKIIGVFLMLVFFYKVQAQPANPQIKTVTSGNVTCNGGANGTIVIAEVSGGSLPLQYSKNNGVSFQPSNTFTGLSAGTYLLVVRDNVNRKSAVVTRQIIQPSPILISRSVVRPSCFNFANGRIKVTVTGGRQPYRYSWSNNPSLNSPILNNIMAGTYVVTVTDSVNCTARDTIVVTAPARLVATAQGTNLTCSNNFRGSVTVNVTGGTPPYSFLWNKGRDSLKQTQTNLAAAGTYFVTVSDTNRCADTSSVTIVRQEFAGKRYAVGDTTSCGIVFYVDSTSLDSISHCRRRYLICAFQDQDASIAWYNNRYILVNSNNDGLFRKTNADKIIQVQGDTGRYAARACARSLVLVDTIPIANSCSGWYLPSKAELQLMYTNLVENRAAPLGNFSFEGYWSSVESSTSKAWIIDFFDGKAIKNDKANKYHIRAVGVFTTQ